MTEPIVSVRDLTKHYGARSVLSGVTFEVGRGEIVGVLGPNGTGKTTTLEILQGLRARDGGDVLVDGVDPGRDRRQLRGRIGAQLQTSALPARIRVDEALRLFARLAGDVVDWRELRDEWGLRRVATTPYAALSGGERQRLFIALALVNRPRLVFLDELTEGLDPAARRGTWRLVERVRAQGATVVLVTHDMEEATRLCDRVVILHRGGVVADGRPAELAAQLGGAVRTRFSAAQAELRGIAALPGVHEVGHDGHRARVLGDAASPVRVAAELARRGVLPLDLDVLRPGLEDVYLALTDDAGPPVGAGDPRPTGRPRRPVTRRAS